MLKLKKLELLGFKSFADRTRLEFEDGTVSIVGPNGCGKSNLSDAMNWVLGEQKARLLRGERMSDVIFNGTGSRPPTGMAEVSLTLEDTDYESADCADSAEATRSAQSADYADSTDSLGDGVSEAESADSAEGEPSEIVRDAATKRAVYKGYLKDGSGQITVTRRLFRSGESEYLINGRACRLRDIQDLFMGTGLGPESYAIIEQGRIGQILSSKPSDRRLILEEAAGISKFKARKRAAELKLESSRGNLSRITDILEEVIKQVNSLKRQASKARRYRELHDEMMGRQKVTLGSRLRMLESQCQQLRKDSETLQQLCAEESRGLELLANEQRTTTAHCEELEGRLISIRETAAENELERQRLQSRLEQIRQQIAALDSRSADAKQESGQVRLRIELLEQEAAQRAQEHEALLQEQAAAEEEGGRLQEKQEELGQRIREAERTVEQARQALMASISRASNLRNQLVQAEEMGLALDRQEARISEERAGVEAERAQQAAELETLAQQNERFQNELAQLAESVSQTAAALEQAQQAEAAGRRELENLRREFSGMQARKQTLEESLARHAYSTESVRRLLNGEFPSNGHQFRPLGVLADFLEVSPGYEEVVEEFLKPELDCVVVEQHAEARSGIEILQAEGTGRSTFFVTRAEGAHIGSNGHHQISQEPGVVASLREMVRLEPRLGLNGDPPLPSLSKAYLVEDTMAAERLAASYPECHFVTRSGEHYHHRLVSGGHGSSAGPLALRRDFRDLERRTVEVESEIQSREVKLAAVEQQVGTLKETLSSLNAARQESEKDSVVGTERLRQVQRALARALERLRVFDEESQRLEAERQSLQSKQMEIRAQLEAEEAEKVRLEAEIASSAEQVGIERQRFDQGAQTLAQAQARFSTLQERTRALAAERARLDAQGREMGERMDHLARQVSGWEENQRQLAAEAESTRARDAELEITHARLKEELQGVGSELQAVRTRRDELRPQVEQARARYEAAREKRSEVEVALARAESDRDHHAGQCRESLQQEPDALLAELAEEAFLDGEALETAEEEVRQLKKKIENLGPLNMMALEELREAEERYEFLEGQRQDLLSSIEDTAQAIKEIDRLSRLQFMEAFNAINTHFAESFRTLFGGGIGQLRLTDEEDPDSGLDIVAQPPGKRLQNILLLSGGEKALAALALLIAIFRYTPSPFCVLDEVDAPLDDTNVGRFTRMIRKMSSATQFILITHNKTTMEIARAIYGVTMEEPGVSKLISVQLEEFEEEPVAVTA